MNGSINFKNCKYLDFLFVFVFTILSISLLAQQEIPVCFNKLIKNLGSEHKKDKCKGGSTFIRMDVYSFNDTLLYYPVFNKVPPCPDYIQQEIYYDKECKVKIRITSGGFAGHHQIWPEWIDKKQIRFLKSVFLPFKAGS